MQQVLSIHDGQISCANEFSKKKFTGCCGRKFEVMELSKIKTF